MKVSICKLRNLKIVNNDGTLVDYQYTDAQSSLIIAKLLQTLKTYTIGEYLGSPGHMPYPDCIVRQIIRKHREELEALESQEHGILQK
jgi:hypothetical protein